MTSSPREIIAHSQFDDETREMLLGVYDRLQREFGMGGDVAVQVVDHILALADAGERSKTVLFQKVAVTASRGGGNDTEQGGTAV